VTPFGSPEQIAALFVWALPSALGLSPRLIGGLVFHILLYAILARTILALVTWVAKTHKR